MASDDIPKVPYRVLARSKFNSRSKPVWRMLHTSTTFRTTYGAELYAGYMEVVDHPKNDPEAVEIVRRCQPHKEPA